MNQQQWTEAAERFREKRARQKAQEVQQVVANSKATQQSQERWERLANAVQKATNELVRFMSSSEWHAAQQLLAASGRHIIIAEENEGGGSGVVYFLDLNGLQQSIEPMGMWMAYARKSDIPKPAISFVSAEEVVKLAIRQGALPDQIIESIRQKLDNLANEVL